MIEGQGVALIRSAILSGETVAQEYVEPRERRRALVIDIGLQRHDRGKAHLEGRRPHHRFILRDDIDAIEEHRLEGVLPRPERQGEIGKRPKVGVENKRRAGFRSVAGHMHGGAPRSNEGKKTTPKVMWAKLQKMHPPLPTRPAYRQFGLMGKVLADS